MNTYYDRNRYLSSSGIYTRQKMMVELDIDQIMEAIQLTQVMIELYINIVLETIQ